MTEVVERVAKLEEQFDAVAQTLTDIQSEMRTGFVEIKQSVARLDERLDAGLNTGRAELQAGLADVRSEMRTGLADVRNELQTGLADVRSEMRTCFAELRSEMRTQLRWMLGGIGGATLVILLAIVGQILLGR